MSRNRWLLDEKIRIIIILGIQLRRVVKCNHCEMWASWRHIASELQVNRALRRPHEFLDSAVFDVYTRLQAQDRDNSLQILDPARSFPAAPLRWMRIRRIFKHRESAHWVGRTPYQPERCLLREIKDGTEATLGSAEFWSNKRMRD